MFSSEKTKKQEKIMVVKKEVNLVGEGTNFVGDIVSEGDFRIDGNVEGTVKIKGRIIVGEKGIVKGKVCCDNADFEGTFSGELEVKSLLTLKPTAVISGEVFVKTLVVEPGAILNASCAMGDNKLTNRNKQSERNEQQEQQKKDKTS